MGKHRRSSSTTNSVGSSHASHLPPDSINPFSRSPAQLLQSSIAGLNDTDENPSLKIRDFPHRSLDYASRSHDADPESDDEGGKPPRDAETKPKNLTVRERQLHVLIQSIHQFLDRGDVAKASRGFSLVLQIQPHGKPINIRHHSLWAIGAEILMRQGEAPAPGTSEGGDMSKPGNSRAKQLRWGSAANMSSVKRYFEALIRQHPYNYRKPQKVSSVDFQLAMLSCEIYNIHAEHVISLSRLEEDSNDWDDNMDGDTGDDQDVLESPQERREARLNELKDELRKGSLAAMRDIAKRMDNIAQNQPFPKNHSFLKLRATASLYMADLVVPVVAASELSYQKGQELRDSEQKRAKAALEDVLEQGGDLDRPAKVFLGVEDDEPDSPAAPVFSSLPIR